MADDNNRWLLEELSNQHNQRVQMVMEDRYTMAVENEKHRQGTQKVFGVLAFRACIEFLILAVLILEYIR